jgi:hypothetical protein
MQSFLKKNEAPPNGFAASSCAAGPALSAPHEVVGLRMRLGVRHLTAILFSRSTPAVLHPD